MLDYTRKTMDSEVSPAEIAPIKVVNIGGRTMLGCRRISRSSRLSRSSWFLLKELIVI